MQRPEQGARRHLRNALTISELQRAERLRDLLRDLYEVNRRVPVIVEGKNDTLALRELGLSGEILTLHNGRGLYEFCEEVSEAYGSVVLLLDWDSKGEQMHGELARNLPGLWEEHGLFRDRLRVLCQKYIKDIEGIPKLIGRLEGEQAPRR